MKLSRVQRRLLSALRSAAADEPMRRVVYCTEYLGYLPFGLYHWFEVRGNRVSNESLPFDFSHTDLDALVAAGRLRKLGEFRNADDPDESRTVFEVTSP